MDLKTILQYQKKDAELIKLEKQLNSNENKKIYTQMISVVKDAQNKSNELEKKAGDLIADYEQLKKSYQENVAYANKIGAKDLDKLNLSDIETMEEIAQTILTNLSILEKKLLAQAEKVNAVLTDFEQTKKRYTVAKEKYNKHKSLFDAESESLSPEIKTKTAELKELEKNVDSAIIAKYNQRRQDKIFPVLVPCIDKACGGCRMELPSASLNALKNNGYLECEHCRRIIYFE